MYEDEKVTYKVGINWKDILIKIILLILFVLLLLWLFPKPNLDSLFDTIYTTNINSMKDAAKSYYTIDKLPENVGDQTSMTLKEMFDNHMLIRFTDKDGKTCDETSSKVEVTKISDDQYALKVQLNCGEQKDYILETIGCTSVCNNGNCTTVIDNNEDNDTDDTIADNTTTQTPNNELLVNKVTYYQHRKAIVTSTTVYTCPAGYTRNGTKCTKATTGATIDATPHYNPDQVVTTDAKYTTEGHREYIDPIKTKTGTNYTCPTGYTLNGSYCIKYTDATEKPGSTNYTCPSGYTKNGTKCEKTYDAKYTAGVTSYTCPNGGTLDGTKCVVTSNATANTTYTCPSGYTKNGSSCYKVYDATASTSYTCPSGYSLSGSKCTKSSTSTINATASTSYGSWKAQWTKYYSSSQKTYTNDTNKLVYNGTVSGATCGSPCGNKGIWYKYTYYTRSKSTNYTCPSGYTKSGSKCSKTTTSTINATANTTYTCPSGYTKNGSKCSMTTTSTINATANTKYSCPNGGTLNGSKCTLTATASTSTNYTCANGTLSGNKCITSYEATAVPGNGSYSCPNGGTLNGTKCVISQDATATQGESTYTCPNGYTLNGKTCELKISATANDIYTYTCPTGYTQEGSGENTKCYKISNVNKYYCENPNAKLEGTKCITTVPGSIAYYTCPTDYTINGTKCTKNSTVTIDATPTKKESTSYKYTWSQQSYLAGWTFTGKTKVVEEKYTAGQK